MVLKIDVYISVGLKGVVVSVPDCMSRDCEFKSLPVEKFGLRFYFQSLAYFVTLTNYNRTDQLSVGR